MERYSSGGYPEINASEREYLLNYYETEIEGLESYAGRDLPSWKAADVS